MRFNVGQKIPFVTIQFERANGVKEMTGFSGLYQPWDHKLINIHVVMLECKEHHKVPNYWDNSTPPKLDCDGFIFTDDEGTRWLNQYPRASYGQTTDTADRVVSREFPEGTDYKAVLNSDTVCEMELGLHRLGQIHHGIFELEKSRLDVIHHPNKYSKTAEEIAAMIIQLQEFSKQVQEAIEKVAGQKIVIDKLTYGPTKKWLEGHYHPRFKSEDQAESHLA
ncbi:hypothetical protein [Ralstonia phage RP13]|nr:hypothetical protein [Ralstonia phage RP13]